ncbi:RNA polymerase sigma factor [Chitinophaga caeni]|uniref:RNA polymerase sigma factor n=1 Tax=Chitinophaga caeni TaxID=2029983 RepID=UPI0012FDE642|nr:sigma-70 family RNA polymerase sigma factor [Chitinophaga caeni]
MSSQGSYHQEEALYLLIAEGSEHAFKQLYAILLPSLTAFSFKILKSEEAVKEVLQEALVRFWLHRDKLPGISQPKSWLFRIVANECYRYLRKNGLQLRLQQWLSSREAAPVSETEATMSFRETQQLIQQAVAGLSSRQREIYRLSREQGLKIPEIAAELNLSSNYVKKTLVLSLQKIRRKLERAGKLLVFLLLVAGR